MLWHPGQVLEGRIGFDRALMVQEFEVWRAIGLSRVPSGAVLGRYLWPPWWGPRNLRRPLPNFKQEKGTGYFLAGIRSLQIL